MKNAEGFVIGVLVGAVGALLLPNARDCAFILK